MLTDPQLVTRQGHQVVQDHQDVHQLLDHHAEHQSDFQFHQVYLVPMATLSSLIKVI